MTTFQRKSLGQWQILRSLRRHYAESLAIIEDDPPRYKESTDSYFLYLSRGSFALNDGTPYQTSYVRGDMRLEAPVELIKKYRMVSASDTIPRVAYSSCVKLRERFGLSSEGNQLYFSKRRSTSLEPFPKFFSEGSKIWLDFGFPRSNERSIRASTNPPKYAQENKIFLGSQNTIENEPPKDLVAHIQQRRMATEIQDRRKEFRRVLVERFLIQPYHEQFSPENPDGGDDLETQLEQLCFLEENRNNVHSGKKNSFMSERRRTDVIRSEINRLGKSIAFVRGYEKLDISLAYMPEVKQRAIFLRQHHGNMTSKWHRRLLVGTPGRHS